MAASPPSNTEETIVFPHPLSIAATLRLLQGLQLRPSKYELEGGTVRGGAAPEADETPEQTLMRIAKSYVASHNVLPVVTGVTTQLPSPDVGDTLKQFASGYPSAAPETAPPSTPATTTS